MEILPNFEYHRPNSLGEAIRLLTQYGDDAKLLAGGTDLLIKLKNQQICPGHVVALKWIPELSEVIEKGDLRIGALATYTQLLGLPIIKRRFSILIDAFSRLGTRQIRNVATVGGNLCNGVPSADTAPSLLALDAKLTLIGPKGKREMNLDEFFIGPGETAIEPGEILTSILLPIPSPFSSGAYIKHTRRAALDLPIVGVAVQCTFSQDFERIEEARIGLGVAAPTPIRAKSSEVFLKGKAVTGEILEEAGSIALKGAKVRETWRGSAFYRSEMIRVLFQDAVLLARERARVQK